MKTKTVWLWRGKHFDGKVGAWTACLGYKPVSRFGGNEYVELVPRWQLDLANEAIQNMQLELSNMLARVEYLEKQTRSGL